MASTSPDLFAWPEEEPVAPPSCARCHHPEAEHERAGETQRSSLRFVPGLKAQRIASWVGTNRYCHEPLCSCIEFVAPQAG